MPRRVRNHRRLAPLERNESGYAIRNDESHGFALLHYYVCPEMQAKQLVEHAFDPIECLDLDGRDVGPEDRAEHCHELHYVARRANETSAPRTTMLDEQRGRPRVASSRNRPSAQPGPLTSS